MPRPIIITRTLWITLILVWLSHLIQVFVPETGFDALWYHLPVVEKIVANRGLIYIPELYQSVNPLFADLIFAVGFFLAQDFGTKVFAYLFGLFLIWGSYQLAKQYLSKNWNLLFLILISSFQVIAWQVSSFYIDVAKAALEIWSLYFLLKFQQIQEKKYFIASGLFFSTSLASKLFSLFLLPTQLFLVYLVSKKKKIKTTILYFLLVFLLPLPFYLFAHQNTGNPFYSFFVHTDKLGEIGGVADPINYFRERLRYIPVSLWELTLAKDYTSIIFLVFLPLIYFYKKICTHEKIVPLFLFAITQYSLWWFLPPTSTRYALSGFIVLALIYFVIFSLAIKKNRQYFWPIIVSIFLAITINLAPRALVNIRSLKYLSGQQTKQQYLEQFYDGSIDRNIKEWHFRTTL